MEPNGCTTYDKPSETFATYHNAWSEIEFALTGSEPAGHLWLSYRSSRRKPTALAVGRCQLPTYLLGYNTESGGPHWPGHNSSKERNESPPVCRRFPPYAY